MWNNAEFHIVFWLRAKDDQKMRTFRYILVTLLITYSFTTTAMRKNSEKERLLKPCEIVPVKTTILPERDRSDDIILSKIKSGTQRQFYYNPQGDLFKPKDQDGFLCPFCNFEEPCA